MSRFAAPSSTPTIPRPAPDLESQLAAYRRPMPSPRWARWLEAGGGGVSELRRWALWRWWTGIVAERGRGHAIRVLLKRPAAVARDAVQAVRSYGAVTRDAGGPSPARQLADQLWLWARWRMEPQAYYQFQLWRPGRRARARQFLQLDDAERLLFMCRFTREGEEDRSVLTDKTAFERWCTRHGFPSTATIAAIDWASRDGVVVPELPAVDLFSKPSNSKFGMGTARWMATGDGGFVKGDETFTAGGMVDALLAQSRELDRPILVQRCLGNHPDLRHLSTGAVCTVRVVTACRSGHPSLGTPEVVRTIYRMPTGTNAADNFAAGGIAAPIDLAQGVLGPAVQKAGGVAVTTVDLHPDTGGRITGTRIPGWSHLLALTLRAHGLIGTHAPIIGWDVAVTPDGPVLIEANSVPCTVLAQMPSGVGLGETAFVDATIAYLRSTFLRPRGPSHA